MNLIKPKERQKINLHDLKRNLEKRFVMWARTDVTPMTFTRNATSQYNEEACYLIVLDPKSYSLRLIFCGHIKNKLCLTTNSNVENFIERISNAVGKPDREMLDNVLLETVPL